MPNDDLLVGLLLGLLVRRLGVDALGAELARNFALALVIAGLRLLVRAISAAVLDDMRDGEAERTGVRLVRFVTGPRGISDVQVRGDLHELGKELGKELDALGVEDRVDARMALRGRDAGADLRGILEVAAVGKAERQTVLLGLLKEMLVVSLRVVSAEDGVLRLALAAIGTGDRADRKDVAGSRATVEAGGMAGDDRKRRLVHASRLSVSVADMGSLGELPGIFLLVVLQVAIHRLNRLDEVFFIFSFHS